MYIDDSRALILWLVESTSINLVELCLDYDHLARVWLQAISLGHDHLSEQIYASSFVLGIDSSRALIPYFKYSIAIHPVEPYIACSTVVRV